MALSIPERSAEDRAAGVLRIDVGGASKRLPTLSMNAAEKWTQELGAQVAGLAQRLSAESESTDAIFGLASFSQTAVLDAVVAYDTTSALGGREWLAEHADPEQLYIAFRQIVRVVFPFVEELGGLMNLLPGLLEAASRQPSSTNGHSPAGVSTPAPSAIASTPSSSSSSGKPARNASAGSTASA